MADMISAMRLSDGRTLEIAVETIDVTSGLPTADESWTYTDRAGHRHEYGPGYPSLRRVVDDEGSWCELCHDAHEDDHLECPLCGEVIVPGMRPSGMFRMSAPGRTAYLLDGRPISLEEAQRLIDAARSSSPLTTR